MPITIDVSPAVNGKAGLGRYAERTAAHIAALHPQQVHLFANVTGAGAWPTSLDGLPRTAIRAGYKPWRMAVLAGQLTPFGWGRLLPAGTRLYHATEHLLPPFPNIPTVLTVHDLIYKLLPEHHKALNYWYLNTAMPIYVKRAAHIIAVSQSTKRDLIEHYGTPAAKVSVVYEAAAPHFTPHPPEAVAAVRQRYGLPARYLVTVGTIEPRKNLARVVAALAALRRDDPDLHLVVVGAEGWLTESFHAAIAAHNLRGAVVRPGYIPDPDLPALLAGAVAAVQASVYEGFGLPVLEAMACGVPLACSATSSMGEVAGEAALTFDPHDVDAIIHALRRLLNDRALRADLRERGLARAAEFSWGRAARETWAVYQQVLRGTTRAAKP
jgi:glycosyltransferase involved in cell wall biosynthesis